MPSQKKQQKPKPRKKKTSTNAPDSKRRSDSSSSPSADVSRVSHELDAEMEAIDAILLENEEVLSTYRQRGGQ